LAQPQLPELARRVLGVDEERFRGFIEDLVLRAIDKREADLLIAGIVLGGLGRGGGIKYSATTAIPYCREKYRTDTGIVSINKKGSFVMLDIFCSTKAKPSTRIKTDIVIFDFWRAGSMAVTIPVTTPERLYYLYEYLYRRLGIGAGPLLDLAREAEAEGDRETASTLRKLYTLLEASGNIIREIEEKDYEQVAEKEVIEKADNAVELLREAREAARKGDTEKLSKLLGKVALEVEGRRATLGGIIDHLAGKGSEEVESLVEMLSDYSAPDDPKDLLERIDIYEAVITVAEHLGLEVERE